MLNHIENRKFYLIFPEEEQRGRFTNVVKEDMKLVGVEGRGCRGDGWMEAGDWLWPPRVGGGGSPKEEK